MRRMGAAKPNESCVRSELKAQTGMTPGSPPGRRRAPLPRIVAPATRRGPQQSLSPRRGATCRGGVPRPGPARQLPGQLPRHLPGKGASYRGHRRRHLHLEHVPSRERVGGVPPAGRHGARAAERARLRRGGGGGAGPSPIGARSGGERGLSSLEGGNRQLDAGRSRGVGHFRAYQDHAAKKGKDAAEERKGASSPFSSPPTYPKCDLEVGGIGQHALFPPLGVAERSFPRRQLDHRGDRNDRRLDRRGEGKLKGARG